LTLGDRQRQQGEHDRDGRGEDRRARRAQGERQRLVLVLVAAQLLSVARDEQQRVVRAGAEDEHGEDRRGLPVDGDAGLREPPAQRPRQQLGEETENSGIQRNSGLR
jgi:hypothetical protein